MTLTCSGYEADAVKFLPRTRSDIKSPGVIIVEMAIRTPEADTKDGLGSMGCEQLRHVHINLFVKCDANMAGACAWCVDVCRPILLPDGSSGFHCNGIVRTAIVFPDKCTHKNLDRMPKGH